MSNPNDGASAGEQESFVEPEEPGARESFDLHDELVEAFGKPRSAFVGGDYVTRSEDLPHQKDDGDTVDAHAPPFLRGNQICIADRSSYVVRGARGVVTQEYPPDVVVRDPDGRYRATVAQEPRGGSPRPPRLVVVQPKRIECKHLVRQLTPPSPTELRTGVVKKGWVNRYCSARRSVAGAFLDLTNSHMGACSIREPFDDRNAAILDDFDDTLEDRSRNREYGDMFALVSKKFLEGADALPIDPPTARDALPVEPPAPSNTERA